MQITTWESRLDWSNIVEAITCPACLAAPAQRCKNLSAFPGTMTHSLPRIDYHTSRKIDAIETHQLQAERARVEAENQKAKD